MKKVLVVDDEPAIANLAKIKLTNAGFDVEIAHSGEEALERVADEFPDVMVLDVMMPNKTGFEFAEELRKDENNIPILFLTAKTEIEDRISGLELGADDYLTKPFDPKELILRIKKKAPEMLVATSFNGNTLPPDKIVEVSDFINKTLVFIGPHQPTR